MVSWFAVHTHPHGEFKAEHHLRSQGYEVYLPKYLKRRRHARKTDYVSAPLFPRYLFVNVNAEIQGWRSINSTVGVSGVVGSDKGPISVSPIIIQEIAEQEDDRGYVTFDISRTFKSGDQVIIGDGALEGASAIFDCLSDQKRARVLLSLLGREVAIQVPGSSLSRQ